MTPEPWNGPHWSTASLHDGSNPGAQEPGALDQHLRQCRGQRRFVLRCAADSVHAFVAGRFVSTLAALSLLVAVGVWLW